MKQSIPDIGFLIKIIGESIARHINLYLQPLGLTMMQGRILGYLHENQGRIISQKDVENHLQVSHPTTVGLIKRLESKGFIRCEKNETDRRNKNIILLDREEACRITKDHRIYMEKLIVKGMSAKQVAQLRELLTIVYKNVGL